MASITKNKFSGKWIIKFRFNGQAYYRSCRTEAESKDKRIKATVEDTIELLMTGRLAIPESTNIVTWIMSGGKVSKPEREDGDPKLVQLENVCDAYLLDQLDKADRTISGEKTHIRHLKRLLGCKASVARLTLGDIQKYCGKRAKESNRQGGNVAYLSLIASINCWGTFNPELTS